MAKNDHMFYSRLFFLGIQTVGIAHFRGVILFTCSRIWVLIACEQCICYLSGPGDPSCVVPPSSSRPNPYSSAPLASSSYHDLYAVKMYTPLCPLFPSLPLQEPVAIGSLQWVCQQRGRESIYEIGRDQQCLLGCCTKGGSLLLGFGRMWIIDNQTSCEAAFHSSIGYHLHLCTILWPAIELPFGPFPPYLDRIGRQRELLWPASYTMSERTLPVSFEVHGASYRHYRAIGVLRCYSK